MIPNFTKKLMVLSILLLGFIGSSQEYNSFEVRYQNNIKGDLTFIGNQILNREVGPGTLAEDPYNNLSTNNDNNPETGGRQNYNDFKNMQYIDVDGDPSTFSSSTTTFNFPTVDCNLIRYAGLYWSATYPSATANGSYDGVNYSANSVPVGTGRQNDFNQVRFRVPGGTYVDVVADEVLFDGFTSTDPSIQANSPYACYADVTALITALPDPTGDYTVANIRATTGALAGQGGSTGGWTLVIVYENPQLTGKLITTFDGFARVRNTDTVDIPYNGFTTIPVGPVNADIGAASLEGDFRITGDRMRISAAANFPTFTTMSNGSNPANNFFNSNITLNGAQLPGRTPSSANTLGWDNDIFRLNNFSNSVIPNGETSATFRFETNGDQYYPFFNSFNIEIIEPDIILEKRVEDIAGNDITGAGVNLGQVLDYVLSFRNIGNDDGDNYTIRDVLPLNVTLDESNFVLPAGVTYTYDPATRTVVFTIPDNLVRVGQPITSLRMRVQVAENCFDFIDACTDLIENLAYSTYQGQVNNNQITDDPSVTEFNNCTPPLPGATNFLLDDLSDCNFRRTVQLCGDDVVLDAGDNFDAYVWVRDDNGNGLFDPTDTVLNDGDPDNDPSTLLVTEEGTYIVDKIVADPCKGFKEIMDVERFGSNTVNPIIDYFNTINGDADVTNDIQGEIVSCSIDGDLLPKIFLCGAGDSQVLQTNITDAQTISWERLDEGSCTASPDDCANKNLGCTWNQVNTGGTYTANTAGKYRLVVTYQNGCFNRFYFDIYQNTLDIAYNAQDIICTTNGFINITNIGGGYGFQLVDITNNNILVPFSANNGPNFPITTNGQYRVDVTQLDGSGNPFPNGCIFSTPEIGILNRDFQVDVTTTAQTCNTQGTIKIDILNVEPDYTYVLRRMDGTLIDDETAQPNNTHTFNINAGDYIVEASSEDGCAFTQNVTVNRIPDPTLSALTTQDIGCSAGTIAMTATGGFPNPDYGYAIWSRDGTDLYASVAAIPGGAYQVEDVFTFGWRDTDNDGIDEYFAGEDGTYVFVVVDANGCFAFSNPVTVNDNGPMTYTVTDDSPVTCSGENTASITINPTGGVAPYEYSIDSGTTFQSTPSFVNLNGRDYTLVVRDASGCEITLIHTIAEPFPLTASAGVSRDATCDPSGAEVRVTNVVGGTAPYEYSFDGGASYGASTIAILPPGTYTVIVRDNTGCTFPMVVDVPNEPTPPLVTLTPEVNYNCNGSGNITATPNIATYDYTYELDGVLNSPDPTSNVFPNVPPGTYTVRTNYVPQTAPVPSSLLSEDFGYGLTIQNPNTTGYFYENQLDDVTPSGAPIDNGRYINDYEYAVTSNIERPFGAWLNPIDHTSGTRATLGRYLVINIGAPTPGQIIYQKPINDIIANQPISVSLWLINLIRSGNRIAPDLTIELRHPVSGTVVASANTGSVPENNIWNEYVLSLDPGTNPSLDLVITTNESEISGNDVAIDDISVSQAPEVCPRFVETVVTVVAGNTFEANVINSVNASCNGLSDGTITFEVENFDATAGFDYSLDGGTTYINATTSPVTTAAVFGAGNQTILIRKADDFSCNTTITQNITEPNAIVASAAITTALSCTNGGATITASATGGTPGYEYQLEDTFGGIITAYQTPVTFTGVAPGSYIVRVRDNNLCEDPIDVALTIAPTNAITFDVTSTVCYSGATDASIQIDVTNGNGNYTFNINGGPWTTPSPTTATTYTFTNLANGNYTINVSDGLGCIGVAQNVTVRPELTVSASAPRISACATTTDISISAAGGDANYVYAIVPAGNTVLDGDFNTTNPATGFNSGTYDVHVRDNGGAAGYCSALYTITVLQDAPISITPTPTPVTCFGGSDGAISIIVNSGGEGPFEFSTDGGSTYQVTGSFSNLVAGTYPVQVRDANNCETTAIDIIVSEPAQLVAEAIQTQDYTCNQLGQITVGSITPTTGGSGNYQYSIDGGAWTTSTTGGHTFTDLVNGTYSIRVRDANAVSCEITLADIVIAPLPVEPLLTTTVAYNCDGTGNITITPFDATYTYILDGVLPGQTGVGANVISNVAVGTHTITVNYGSDCTVDTTVIVEPGNAFEASITAFENLDCNSDNSGTITIIADNFGASGYEYSLDGSTFIGPFSSAEQIIGLAAQLHTITVRDVDSPISGCTIVLNQTLTEPSVIITSASITEEFRCNNTGATITASALGGTPTYEYQLEDTVGGIITAYQVPTIFTNVLAGDYIVRARDVNGCSDPIDTAITVVAPTNPTFTTTPTACYSGANDGSIVIDVTSLPGNGGFQFSLNSGPWLTPTPATATTYTFGSLANGTYTIDVRDAYGCAGIQQTITLDPQLTATVDVVDVTCNDGSISVNATGGDGNFAYAFVTTGTTVTAADFGPSNTFTVTAGNDGVYDVYVWDNNAVDPHCEFMETVQVEPATPIVFTATPTDPECHDGVGSIEVNITSGDSPYQVRIVDLSNGGASDETRTNTLVTPQIFFNLSPGDYEVYLQDANGCEVQLSPNVTIDNPDELTANVIPILPAACGSVDPLDYGFQFTGYPTTYPVGTTIEFSADGGATWTGDDSNPGTSDRLMGYISGTSVFPSMRTIIGGVEVCRTDLPRFIIPFPLDDLDISISTVVVACNELQVTVQGTAGVPNYEYTYTDDPATFNIATATWTAAIPGAHTWTGLIPGRTYVFYVRDSTGCIRQSNVNVNDITINPIEITSVYEPSCSGANDAEITYTLTDTDATSHPDMRWEFYNATTNALIQSSGGNIAWNTSITVAGLATGEYYIVVTEVDAGGVDACVSGSENLLIEELDPITANLSKLSDISCNAPGLIAINNIQGGGGTYNFTVTGPVGFTTITGTSDNPISIPANSTAGDYFVRVTDQFGCFADFGPINLTLTPNPTIDTMLVDNCASPTSLTINATSTATQILYSIDGGTNYVDNGGVFNNVTPGTYNVAIIDSNGCTDTDTVTVYPVLEANVNLTKLLDCTVSPDAEITIEVTFGSGNYDYEITNGLGTVVARTALPSNPYVFTATIAEDYVITVFDNATAAPECNRVFPITVPAAIIPSFTEVHTNVTCNGSTDGTITLTEMLNGINPLSYTITPAAGTFNPSTNTFENLPIGTYTVTGRGTNNCPFDITGIVIDEPAIIAVPSPTIVEFICTVGNNSNNATITIDGAGITGGSNTYVRYEFINDQGTPATGDDVVAQDGASTIYTETNLAGGTYIINVYDDRGCVGSTTATILPFDELLPATLTVDTEITCTNSGENITINAFGSLTDSSTPAGLANYEFRQLPAGAFQASNQFTNLPIGNHAFEVRNINTGCVVSITHDVLDPNTFEISTATVDVVCFGDNGSVSFTINDPVNAYANGFTWQIYDSQGTAALGDDVIIPSANGISANVGPTAPFAIPVGEYRVEITQDSDPACTTNALFTIAGPSAAITANTDVTPITCVGNDGIIEIIDVLGGWGDYAYYVGTVAPTVVGDYVSTPRFENLAPGTYQAWVIDQNGCQQEVQSAIVLANPTPINAQLQLNQPNCPNFTGEIEVINVTGGQGSNYTYQLIKDGTPIGSSQNTTIFSGLDAGSYTVQITDQWTCTFTTAAELLYAPIIPLATVVKGIDCTVDPGGQVTITQTGGSGAFDYLVTFPDATTTATNTTGVFTALTQVGDYVFTITDQAVGHACPITITQNIQDRILPDLNIDAFTDVTCNGADDGTITVSTLDNGLGPYTFEIVSGPGSSASFPIASTLPPGTSGFFTGLEGNITGITYTIRVTGINECFVEETQTIIQPEIIDNINATVVEFGCTAGNNPNFATISIDEATITGGTGIYVRYEFIHDTSGTTVQDGPNTMFTETNLAGGDYTINVYDENGCVGSTTAVIFPFVVISDPMVATNIDVTCNPGNDSEIQVGITVTPASATPNIEYVVAGTDNAYSQTNASGLFAGLGVGNYTITITNLDTNCVIETTHQILDPDIIEVTATKLTDEECLNNGVDDGSFSVSISNYIGNYSYQVFDLNNVAVAGYAGTGNTSIPLIISNLPGGGYYVRITETDLPLCEENSNAITIVAPSAPITIAVSEEASPSCTNDQGGILVDPEGGTGPYTIILDNTTTSQTYTETGVEAFLFTGLSAGDYTINVIDVMGCPETETITLIRPDSFLATVSSTPLSCFNGNNATVFTTEPSGRNVTAVYQYQLNSYDDLAGTNLLQTSVAQPSTTFTGISTGFYSITITDDFGCSFTSPIEQIVNPSEVTAQLIRTSPLTCLTGIDFELTASGGLSGSYEYSVDDITWTAMTGNTVIITEPIAGTYRYFVRDAINLCTPVLSNEITEDPIEPLVLTVDESAAFINCNGDSTASIYASATGGLGGYMYELFTDVSLNIGSRIAGPVAQGEFNVLTAGTYYVSVVSGDCTTPPQEVVISEPSPLDYTDQVVDVLCFGDENGSITITLSGGSGGYQYAISPNLNQFDDNNVFDELAPGDYTVIAQDQNGCFLELQYTINEPEALSVSAVATPEICEGDENGIIDLTITGGTAPYSTRLSSETSFVQDRISFVDRASGAYIIFVRDANGCEFDLGVTIDSGVNLNAIVEPIYECTGDSPGNYLNITLEDTTVMGDILYALDSTDPNDLQLNPDFRNSAPGSHYVRIAHSNGCFADIPFEIQDFEPLTLTLEQPNLNVIGANAAGGKEDYTYYFNDDNNGSDNTYRINRSGTYIVRVVDDNGCEAIASIEMEFIDIEIPNFFTPDGDGLNDFWMPRNQEAFPEILTLIFDRYGREVYRLGLNDEGWNGIYNENELPTGDYWYVIKLRGESDDREFVGHFTLYR